MESSHLERLENLEKKYNSLKYFFGFCVLLFLLTLFFAFKNQDRQDEIIKAKGIIIVDSKGNPRIIMGAPIKNINGRKRTDELTGISYLDENGIDRVTFGKEPNPMTSQGIKERRVGGAGILIHDAQGIERGGYGVLDDETALLTLDWPKTGEAIAISSGKDFSGIGLFHKSKVGEYREALVIGNIVSKKQTFMKIVDTAYNDRFRIEANGNENVKIKKLDDKGNDIE